MFFKFVHALTQVTVTLTQSVERFLHQCGSSVTTNDALLRDCLMTRLEAVINILEEAMQYIGVHDGLHELRRVVYMITCINFSVKNAHKLSQLEESNYSTLPNALDNVVGH